ncbi:hypothetical protein K2D_18410 [Planctomycetes bacterium K2D]|uniref:Uncharacterized protein n=1 Tax=Botrimarina mediterranea TaxID=2528022 RepID=A0A518K787_9BACT|nr:hypothetical protein Spa11_18430 [Botrimarina mediterranea]QDV78234.1 hypothetical protein K2D_18410 [Planctomycetes bacterium K2D]
MSQCAAIGKDGRVKYTQESKTGFQVEPVSCPVDGTLCESGQGQLPISPDEVTGFRVYCERCD